jgi:hypothetical protein
MRHLFEIFFGPVNIWRVSLDVSAEAHVRPDVKRLLLFLLLLSDFNKILLELDVKFRKNPFSGSRVVSFARIKRLLQALPIVASAPESGGIHCFHNTMFNLIFIQTHEAECSYILNRQHISSKQT